MIEASPDIVPDRMRNQLTTLTSDLEQMVRAEPNNVFAKKALEDLSRAIARNKLSEVNAQLHALRNAPETANLPALRQRLDALQHETQTGIIEAANEKTEGLAKWLYSFIPENLRTVFPLAAIIGAPIVVIYALYKLFGGFLKYAVWKPLVKPLLWDPLLKPLYQGFLAPIGRGIKKFALPVLATFGVVSLANMFMAKKTPEPQRTA